MIPLANITAWRKQAPWPLDVQVEQDLVLSRALVEIFRQPAAQKAFVFLGGTALHKLYISPAARYSEDIDLVQTEATPIGPVVDTVRKAIDPWMGEPRWKATRARFTLIYRFRTSVMPIQGMRLKIAINTREHFSELGIAHRRLSIANPWFGGEVDIPTYKIDELLGTKLRALYQRKKGRDLFDLALARSRLKTEPKRIVQCFSRYLEHDKQSISRAEFEANFAAKLQAARFTEDVPPQLPRGTDWNMQAAALYVQQELLPLLPGQPWKGLQQP